MTTNESSPDIQTYRRGHVAIVAMRRAPHNFLEPGLLAALAHEFEALDDDNSCRAVVLASDVKSFCAGADFASRDPSTKPDPAAFYRQALRLFRTRKPIVAAVQGAAVGAGVGLALAADFRVTCPEARFSVNFNRLGFHPGFGLSLTLPRLIGQQHAAMLFYTGSRIDGVRAVDIGLADQLCNTIDDVREQAISLATDIAASAPLAVESTRATLRANLADLLHQSNQRELQEQAIQFATADFREGVAAMAARRLPVFQKR